jgi:amino acid adenylation domain-containing protein
MSNESKVSNEIVDAYPLTVLQAGMLFHSEYSTGSAVYHDIFTYHLKSVYNFSVLYEVLEQIVLSQPLLRTSFNMSDFSEPLQLVYEMADIPLEEIDLRPIPEDEHDKIVAQWVESEKKRPFDWSLAPLFRMVVHRRTNEKFDISISFHHSILDGWSMANLMSQLLTLYLGKLGVIDYNPVSVSESSYRDFVALERMAVESEVCKSYWVDKLQGSSLKKIPRWPVAVRKSGNATRAVEIPSEVSEGLNRLSKSMKVPVKTILLAAHMRVMSIITGEFDMVTGLVSNGRPEEVGGEALLGLFLNTLPFRMNLNGGTWKELIQQTFDNEQEMLPYRRFPLAEIQKVTKKKDLFETMFNFTNFHIYKHVDGLELTGVDSYEQTNFNLSSQFTLDLENSQVRLSLVYDTGEFSGEQINDIASCFAGVLKSIAFDPDKLYFNKESVNYLRDKFMRELPVLNLLTDNQRTVDESLNIGSVEFEVDKITKDRLFQVATENGTALYEVILAAFNIFMFKYTGQEDIITGIEAEREFSKEFNKPNEDMSNYFVIRNQPQGAKLFNEFLKEVHNNIVEAYRLQDRCFVEMAERNNSHIVSDRNPLFDVLFTYKGLIECVETDDKKSGIEKNEFLFKPQKYDIRLNATETEMGISLILEYNTALFKEETIRRMKQHLLNILIKLSHAVNMKIINIEIISDEEKRRILGSFNNTDAEYMKEKTIHGLFEEQVKKTPDKTAVIFGDEKLSYRELNEKTNMLARTLRKRGIRSDSIVGIMVERSVEMLIGIFGILKAGGAYLPIDPEYPEDRVNYMLEDSKANVLLTRKRYKEGISFPGVVVNVDDKNEYDRDGSNLDASGSSGDLAYVIYTSGSTGKPKGAMIEHHSVINRIFWMNKAYPIDGNDVILQKTTYTFDVSVWELFWWSFVGAGVCLLENKGEKDPDVIIESIKKNNVTVMHFVPSMFNSFLHYIEMKGNFEEIAGLKQIFCSGEALSVKHIEMFNRITDKARHIKLINLYGPTEATVDVSHYECRREEKTGVIPIGKPIDNIRLYIIGSNRELQPIGLAGELCISGVGLARGYLNKPELTEEKFIDNPFEPGKKMYRTGDLARWMPDGNIEYLGRMDFQVKIRGFRIELGEIESVLRKHTGVKDAVVTAKSVGNEGGDKKLVAYLVPKEGETLIETQLREYLGEKLPEYMVPTVYVMMDEIPLTSSGKANIRALPEPETADLRSKEEYVAPSTDTEKKLAEVWGKVLGIEKVSINDNFFNLGGDSILSIQVMALAKKNGLDLSIQQLFKYPTIRGLSQTLNMTETEAEDEEDGELFGLLSEKDRAKMLKLTN